jgi:hypothetical protein
MRQQNLNISISQVVQQQHTVVLRPNNLQIVSRTRSESADYLAVKYAVRKFAKAILKQQIRKSDFCN